jgi:RNA polymerase sigma factor (sigma-70 family)
MSQLKTVHLMDVDPAESRKLECFLEHFGYTVTRHATACELLATINNADYGVQELQDELAAGNIICPVILMAADADVKTSVRAIKAGAVDFLEKPLNHSELLNSLQEAFSQSDATRRDRELRDTVHNRFNTLSPREQEVMRYIVNGTSNQSLASRLAVSVRTIEVHRSRVMKKMGADSLAGLVRLADLLDVTALQIPRPEP